MSIGDKNMKIDYGEGRPIITKTYGRAWLSTGLPPLIHQPVIEERRITDPVQHDESTH